MISTLTPRQRVERVLNEVEGVFSSYGINDFEKQFLGSNKTSTYQTFTDKMEAVMRRIEKKVFPDQTPGDKPHDTEEFEGLKPLDGSLRFKK